MATSEGRRPNPSRPKPVFTVFGEEEDEAHSLLEEHEGRGCFQSFPCFGSTRESRSALAGDCASWVGKRAKSVREFSEVVAGPKWKNFVRKIGAYFSSNKKRGVQYDSFNYALNFDDGRLNDDEDQGRLVGGFSARFAAPIYQDNRQQRPGIPTNTL